MANRATAHLSFGQLVAEGSDFARDAWRECWLPMALVALSHTLMFLNQHVALAEWRPGPLGWIAPLLMIFYVPLYGGLYRAALGGRPAAGMGPGGLQWLAVEWRLVAVGLVIAFLTGLAMTPFSALTGIAALIMRNGVFSAGPFGQWARWTPFAIVVWGVFSWIFAPRIGRLMLGWPFSVAREKTEPFAGFAPSKGSGWTIAFALVACFVPLVLGWLAFYAIGLVEADTISGVYWPLPEAIGIGLLLGALKAGVVAPLIVGVLSGAYWLLEGDRLAAEGPDPKPHHSGLMGLAEAAVAAAAALAAKEAADLGLAHHAADKAEGEATTATGDEAASSDKADVEVASDGESQERVAGDDALAEVDPAHAEEAAAIEARAGADIATEHAEAQAAEASPAPTSEPETPALATTPAPSGGIEPLSPWPHSVLPPWPVGTSGAAAARPTLVAANPELAKASDSLASAAKPAHPSDGVTESG